MMRWTRCSSRWSSYGLFIALIPHALGPPGKQQAVGRLAEATKPRLTAWAQAQRLAAGCFCQLASLLNSCSQIVRGRQHDAVAPLGVAGLVHNEDALGMRAEHGVGLPARQPAAIERRSIPG